MALNQRRTEILNLIQEDGHAKVQKLSKIFKVSDVTIRQDLEELEKMGYIQREHGGAFLKDVGTFAKTGQLFNKSHMDEKIAIAKRALSMRARQLSWTPVPRQPSSPDNLSVTRA